MTPDSSTVLQILHNRGPSTPDEIYLLLDSSGPWLYSNISYLRRNGWIVAELPKEIENSNGVFPDTKISITEKGKEALYDHLNREKIERKISIRYWITTGISLVALAVAIISIVLQSNDIKNNSWDIMPHVIYHAQSGMVLRFCFRRFHSRI